jgi:anti-anti-sigma factor
MLMKESPKGISVGCGAGEVIIRVVGRGTFQNSAPLRRFAHEMILSGCREFVLDLARCQGLDSTFLGVLAGVALRLRHESDGGTVRVLHANESQRDLIRTLGLDRLFRMEPDGAFDAADEEFEVLPDTDVTALPAAANRDEVADLMLQAHADLVVANESNRDRFSEVTRCLRERLARRQATAQKS